MISESEPRQEDVLKENVEQDSITIPRSESNTKKPYCMHRGIVRQVPLQNSSFTFVHQEVSTGIPGSMQKHHMGVANFGLMVRYQITCFSDLVSFT